MKTYEWTTAKGARVEAVISQEHTETMFCDGDTTERTVKAMRLEKFFVNGVEYDGDIRYHKGDHVISFDLNGIAAATIIPEDIYNDMMAPTREREEAARKIDKEYQDSYNKVTRAMTLDGGTY